MRPREVYPNPPVVLVAVEIRHPTSGPLDQAATASLKRQLAATFPLHVPASTFTVTMTASGMSQEPPQTWPRYMTRDKTTAVTYRDNAIVVEITRYTGFTELRSLVELALEARHSVALIDGVERIGMRYINEIRVPELHDQSDWATWIAAPLVAGSEIKTPAGLGASIWQGLVLYGAQQGPGAVLRYGTADGYAFSPDSDLRRSAPPPGPYFLVDIDSFWVPEGETPELETSEVLDRLEELNDAATDLFEASITDRLRKEVFDSGD